MRWKDLPLRHALSYHALRIAGTHARPRRLPHIEGSAARDPPPAPAAQGSVA